MSDTITPDKCYCHQRLNAELRARNLRLVGYAFIMPGFTLMPTIKTEWVNSAKAPKGQKRNPPAMIASHCPFCGRKIEQGTKEPEKLVANSLPGEH